MRRALLLLVVLAVLSTSAASVSAVAGPVGFVGCSNSRMTVQGYQLRGGTRFWVPASGNYNGGVLVRWAAGLPNNTYWAEFRQMLAANPGTQALWLSTCALTTDTDQANYTAATQILAEMRSEVPGVPIYVSAVNGYVAPHVCDRLGPDGPSRMQTLADRLVSEGSAQAGPDVGDLISVYQTPSAGATAQNNQTITDGCHPNGHGQLQLGGPMLNFFGQ